MRLSRYPSILKVENIMGAWYTDVKAWKVSRDGSSADEGYPAPGQDVGYGSFESSSPLTNDDIPF